MKTICPKPHLRRIQRIPHSKESRLGTEPMDRNERTVDFPPEVMEEIRRRVTPFLLRAYPEPEAFYARLSGWLRLPRSMLLVTGGADGGLRSIFEAFVSAGEAVVTAVPSYGMMPVYCGLADAVWEPVRFDQDLTLPLERILSRIGQKTRAVVLANPNQPIERVYTDDEIERLVKACEAKGTLLVMDEAYHHFCPVTAVPWLDRSPCLFVVRSFSKAWGLAGLRLGYLMSQPQNIEALNKVRPMYEASSVSMAIGSYLLEREALMEEYVRQVRDGMQALASGIGRMGLRTHGKHGNALLVELPRSLPAGEIAHSLKRAGFLVRAEEEAPLANHLRITAGPREQAERLLDLFRPFVERGALHVR